MLLRLRSPALSVVVACSLAVATGCAGGGDSPAAEKAAATHPPVVMLVFDEFSTVSLLDERGRIDAVRYPNFASLARQSSWFPYATASLDETGRALRSLFTGKTTSSYVKPTYAKNPDNIFTLLGRRYRLNASEEVTSLCPRRLCPQSRTQTQRSILRKLAAGRPERLERWLRSVRPEPRPTFYFKHILFPHAPWNYLPSGRTYGDGPTVKGFSWRFQHFNRWLVNQRYQQHLLQVAYTDRLLGKVLERLRSTGLYDRALIVLTADNGESFGRLGNGHEISRQNAAEIALTPLFVKLPHQRSGRTVNRHVRTIDVVPTIARVAHVRPRWRVEGRSVIGPSVRRIPGTTLLIQRSGNRLRLTHAALRRRAADSARLKSRLFGSGSASLYRIGPSPVLHGTPLGRWPALPPGGTRAVLDLADRYASVRLGSGSLPVKVMGRLMGPGSGNPADIAVAVNGTIAATAPTVARSPARTQYFSALVPEGSLREGANTVQIFAIVPSGGGPALRPLTP